MTERSISHENFTLTREYRASPARVFQAFADPSLKAQWFGVNADDWQTLENSIDFRDGGHEHNRSLHHSGFESVFDAHYHQIIEDTRIVYGYDMHVNGEKISASLATIEITPTPTGALLTVTEHGAFFDDLDYGSRREEGTRQLLEALAPVVES